MGCDIHVWIEKRSAEGVWELQPSPSGHEGVDSEHDEGAWKRAYDECKRLFPITRSRNYERFAKLAGVRGDGPEANDWPPDICPELAHTKLTDTDLHSHCHYKVEDAAKIFADTEYEDRPIAGIASANPAAIYFNLDSLQENLDDYRILIAFDN